MTSDLRAESSPARGFGLNDNLNATSRSLNPELLYGQDDDDDDNMSNDETTSVSGFKSSFAREIMQNVRNQNGPARRYLAISQQGKPDLFIFYQILDDVLTLE